MDRRCCTLQVLKRLLFCLTSAIAFAQAPSFDYPHTPFAIRKNGAIQRGDIRVDDVSFANLAGGRTSAYLVHPPGRGKGPGALFVHWYDGESPTSNRTQFLDEAVALAKLGLTSLLVETPWSQPMWYQKRNVSRDYDFSVQEVKELRHDVDVLLAQPRVDKKRVAYVGHDFGAMYGIVMNAVDRRISAAAFQAGTSTFSEWFLYNQEKLAPEGKAAVVQRLSPLDPVGFIGKLGIPVLLQFAKKDFYVPPDKAQALFDVAREPKRIEYYDSGHGLNAQASSDRQAWLRERLALR